MDIRDLFNRKKNEEVKASNLTMEQKLDEANRYAKLLTHLDYDGIGRKKNNKVNPLLDEKSSCEVKFSQFKYQASNDVLREALRNKLSNQVPDFADLRKRNEYIDNYAKDNPDKFVVRVYNEQITWAKNNYLVEQKNVVIDNPSTFLSSFENKVRQQMNLPEVSDIRNNLENRRSSAGNNDLPVPPNHKGANLG